MPQFDIFIFFEILIPTFGFFFCIFIFNLFFFLPRISSVLKLRSKLQKNFKITKNKNVFINLAFLDEKNILLYFFFFVSTYESILFDDTLVIILVFIFLLYCLVKYFAFLLEFFISRKKILIENISNKPKILFVKNNINKILGLEKVRNLSAVYVPRRFFSFSKEATSYE